MSGINAVSVSKSHTNSGADVAATGFFTNERIALTASPAGSGYLWSLSAPNSSAPAYSAIDDDTDANPAFTPDVDGIYTVSVLVDGVTLYILRLTISDIAIVRQAQGTHYPALANAQIPTPQTGGTLYWSSESAKLVVKDSAGVVTPLY